MLQPRLLISLLLLISLDMGISHAQTELTDSVGHQVDTRPRQRRGLPPLLRSLYHFVQEFSRVDTNYVEPQHYNFTAMLQNTNTYEVYHIRNRAGQEIVFSPKPSYRLGPYFGWRWIFLGYTIDLTQLGGDSQKQDFNLSLYSNQIGVDLFYRKSGDVYCISDINLGDNYDMSNMKGVGFSGFRTSIVGFNIYYIFNHRKFSYPAAYSQSTVQRRSCGSPMLGIGYTKHKLDIDLTALRTLAEERMGNETITELVDSSLLFSNVKYTDYSVSGGYAYNWVFAHNWLFDISLQAALGYKHAVNDLKKSDLNLFRNFDFKNFNIDGIFRMGIVWNNTRWYAGTSAVFHTYNYSKSQFSTNNMFGNVNFYVGFNFGKR